MAINETTLEARIDGLLKTVFPGLAKLDIEHQLSFTLKFGHHLIHIDGKNPSRNYARAISDILLKKGGQNLVLLELKKEGLKLTQDDIDQGLSYARLMHPMPPITLISNGTDHKFYNTYTKEPLKGPPDDLEAIEGLMKGAFDLALKDQQEAINTLLNGDCEAIMQIFNQLTQESFDRMTGNITELAKPICSGFLVIRDCVEKISEQLKTQNVFGILGGAFSGKTNTLYQYFNKYRSNEIGMLYINGSDYHYSLFQKLANHFTKSFGFLVDQDMVRHWIIASLRAQQNYRIVLLVDNLHESIASDLKKNLYELFDLFSGTRNAILFTADEYSFNNMATIQGRNYKSMFGDISQVLLLTALNDQEYLRAQEQLYNSSKAIIQHGGHKTYEYRHVRILRYLCAIHQKDKGLIKEGQVQTIVAVPDFGFLTSFVHSSYFTTEIKELSKKFARAFVKERKKRRENAYLSTASLGTAAVSKETVSEVFKSNYEKALTSGIFMVREILKVGPVIFPKVPELITYYTVEVITQEIEKCTEIDLAYELLIDFCTYLPYGDIIGSEVLLEILKKEKGDLFVGLVDKLHETVPAKEGIGKGTKTLSFYEDIGHLQLNFEDSIDEGGLTTNFLQPLILSQMLASPFIQLDENGKESYIPYARLLTDVASIPLPVIRMSIVPFKEMQSYETLTLGKYGEVISGHEGIVEPIVQSIQKVFYKNSDLIIALYKHAIQTGNFHLLWRIYLALRDEIMSTDEETAKTVKAFLKEFNKKISDFFGDIITQEVKDPVEKERIKELLRNSKHQNNG